MIKYGFKNRDAEAFPQIIIMGVTNVCNMACIHCHQKEFRKNPLYKPTFLDWGLFKKAADEIARHKISVLRITTKGEPLIHPRLLDMIAYCKKINIYPVDLTTNGYLLSEDVAGSLIDAGLNVIDISIDAFTASTYKDVRGRPFYDTVVGNVLRLIEMRDRKRSPLKIMVSVIDQKEVEAEIKDFTDFWSPKADRVLVRTYYNIGGLGDSSKEKFKKDIARYPCPQLWKRVMIDWDGNLLFCVNDWYKESAIGDLKKGDTIEGLWNSPLYKKMRQAHLEGRYKDIPLCAGCTNWAASKWDYGFEHAVEKVLECTGDE